MDPLLLSRERGGEGMTGRRWPVRRCRWERRRPVLAAGVPVPACPMPGVGWESRRETGRGWDPWPAGAGSRATDVGMAGRPDAVAWGSGSRRESGRRARASERRLAVGNWRLGFLLGWIVFGLCKFQLIRVILVNRG